MITVVNDDSDKMHRPLQGIRVLVVEDEYYLAMLMIDILEELGCEVEGPCPTVSLAFQAIERGCFDVALLDYHLVGEDVSSVAEHLIAIKRPFAFASGGGAEIETYGRHLCLRKPFMVRDVERLLCALVSRSANET